MLDKLFEPGLIGTRKTENRFVAQPMESNSADPGGAVSELVLEKYRKQARGRWGVLGTEAISITGHSLARRNGLILSRKNLDGFKRLVDAVKSINPDTLLLFQITHSGSVSNPDFSERVCVSPHGEGRYLSADEIRRFQEGFVACSLLAEEAGADGIDFKICHGYLGAETLRPMNTRDDEWGGCWENRTRFLREGIGEILARRRRNDFLVGSRFSMYEGWRGGCGTVAPDDIIENLDEQKQLIGLFHQWGVDFLNVTAGIPAKTPMLGRPTQQAELMYLHHLRYTRFTKEALTALGSKIPVVGSAYSVLQERAFAVAEEMLGKGYTDFVGWGRQTLADPLMPLKLMNGDPVDYCSACSGCSKMMVKQIEVGCIQHNSYYKAYWKQHL